MDGSDVLEVLLSLGDFPTFKDIMLSYKTEMAGAMFHVDVRSSVLHFPQVRAPAPCHAAIQTLKRALFQRCFFVSALQAFFYLFLLMWCIRWGWAAAWTSLLRILAALTTTIARKTRARAGSCSPGRRQIFPACSLFHPWFVLMITCFCFINTRRAAEPAVQGQRRSAVSGARCDRSPTHRKLQSSVLPLPPPTCFTPGSNVQIHVAGRNPQ